MKQKHFLMFFLVIFLICNGISFADDGRDGDTTPDPYLAETSETPDPVVTDKPCPEGIDCDYDDTFVGTTGVGEPVVTGSGTYTANDQVILDDLIVDGSECVGMDCVNGESFGFDTIRLKENNLRIHFQDTSNSASFPTRDWRITINDSSNGGDSYFGIDDVDGGRSPFRIEAGAPSYSLFVEDTGQIGFGTNNPAVELHISDGDTPTVRLDQDGTSGWSPQIWDMAGNEANFFIRDVTNGSALPFRIQPGAPSSALTIKNDGKVGIGTWSPDSDLTVIGEQVKFKYSSDDSDPDIVFETTDWYGRITLHSDTSGDSLIDGFELVFEGAGENETATIKLCQHQQILMPIYGIGNRVT